MPVYTIETPDGRRLKIEADDEATAIRGAEEWSAGNAQTNEQRYQSSLNQVRQSQFPDFTDQQWNEYSQQFFAPQDFQGIAQAGQLFGFTDEIGAGLGALGSQARNWLGDSASPGFGEAYGQYAELEQARRNLGKEQMGEAAALGAEVLGGASIFGAPTSVASALTQTAVQPSRLQTVGAGLLAGGAMGGLYGFGSADEERGAAALQGGLVGGVVGAAAPYIADVGTALYRGGQNLLARRTAAAQMGVSPEAAQIARQITGFDNSLGAPGQQNLAAAGGEAMLLDAGPNAQSAADFLMRRPGAAGGVINEALSTRASRDAQALQDALNTYLGDPQGVATLRRNIATANATERGQAYDEAYNALIDYNSPQGQSILDLLRNVPASARSSAQKLMTAELGPQAQLPMNLAQLPSVRDIDYITRALRFEAQAGEAAGAFGGQTDLGSAYINLAGGLRGAAKDAAPAYANALETAADDISKSQATQLGYDLLSPNLARDKAAMQIQGMSNPEKEAVALGIRSKIDENISNVSRAVTTGREDDVSQALRAMRDLTSQANRQKVALAIGEEDAALLFEEVDRIFLSLQREALRRTGSQTAGRQYAQETFDPAFNPQDIFSAAGQGKGLQAGQRIVQALTGMTPERMAVRSDQIATDVARLLVAQGDDLSGITGALTQYNNSANGNDAVANALARRVLAFGGALPYPAAILQQGNSK